MVTEFFSWLSSIIIEVISATGYFGVTFLMLLESACLPVPSEIIMPFAGFLVWQGKFSLGTVIFWGAVGNLLGSIIAYVVGFWGGRKFIERWGKYFLISIHDLELSDQWFKRFGQAIVFFGRLMPIVRTFISLPAGIAKMDFKKFCFYTFLGSLPWSFFLAYSGVIMGENWESLKNYFHKFDIVIAIFIIFGIGWWLKRHFKNFS